MNVEIGTESTQFPEKEYVHKRDFLCSAPDSSCPYGLVFLLCAVNTHVGPEQ